jgi:hypothetical protein
MVGQNRDATARSEQGLLNTLVSVWEKDLRCEGSKSRKNKPILHSSFNEIIPSGPGSVVPHGNGFVNGIMRAFQQDLHLVLRPDDVWLAITTQFSFYVTRHAEKLRAKFAKYDGKKELMVWNELPFTCRRLVPWRRRLLL